MHDRAELLSDDGRAACASLVERPELSAFALDGSIHDLDEVLVELAGTSLVPGGIARGDGVWWGRTPDGRVLALVEPEAVASLRRRLAVECRRTPALTVEDPLDVVVFGLAGPGTNEVLVEFGVLGPAADARGVAPCTRRTIAGATVAWLLPRRGDAFACVSQAHAGVVREELAARGRMRSLVAAAAG
ncbi:hypothetical protein [Conexibacter woesei]|uniref:Sarcosine oxidase gamma subunit n=1 Tax=Conexibacter woesei (strain DSM 14684 / CCUG 47730 / CIP 108061 / JCM 11494 / NBRC 100937 / ID131577) TaxID=469383 RepID=D3F6X4_CONWI|nr:hypothetical protein [Conexibacter woesei]ADB52772.1 hypothetical protein Cwoe_4358 [Conexibacter woesei DSM 14684]